tara:strand:+ start:6658 stop:6963 length:306 start_codon:yes stop_codon:yes gene_type:complete
MASRTKHLNVKRRSDKKKYYKPILYPPIPLSINDLYVVTSDRDRLDLLANQFYNDVDLWWVIANANPNIIKRDTFLLKQGLEIRIPQNIDSIITIFQTTNK